MKESLSLTSWHAEVEEGNLLLQQSYNLASTISSMLQRKVF